ncbi:MAG: DUF4835 family protein [Janthinobacterium lividum]
MRKLFSLLAVVLTLLAARPGRAQELNAQVTISLENTTITDQSFVQGMQKMMVDFLNGRTWTRQTYQPNERINVRMFVGINSVPQNGVYQATMRLVATRPIYGTGYETNLLSISDRNFIFAFTPTTSMDFSANSYASNLSSLLSFYAYLVIATDQDTFSRLGGSPYYDQARIIMQYSASQSGGDVNDEGWTSGNSRNRYWLLNNLTDPQLEGFRTALYSYYRQGMDVFVEKADDARASILTALTSIQKGNATRPGTLFVRAFFDAKADEITNVFRTATPEQKQKLLAIAEDVDPGNLAKYQAINTNR